MVSFQISLGCSTLCLSSNPFEICHACELERLMLMIGLALGTLSSLKNRKQDTAEMRKGTECGMGFEGWTGFEVGDQVQSYEEKIEKRTL